nr:retrovirus-related Pol polyprotein from transposon TNT 1-94 [Tanacetum cinerariifolium]
MNCDFLETQYYYSPQHIGQREEQGDPLSWLSYTSAATIGNEIQNHSTTSTEAPNISATPEHLKLFFQSKGIVHQTTCPHTPEQNGVAERKNRLLLEMTRALIIESYVPKSFWPEALATATYLINRLPTKILKMKTPLETLSEYTTIPQPLTLQPKVFGCSVFVHIHKSYRDKLDLYAKKYVFVGYGVNQKGYKCYSLKTHRLFTSMNCDFLETQYYYSPQHSGQGEEQGDPLSWLSYTSAATIGNEIQNYSTTSTEAPNISATPKHPVPDMISKEHEEEVPRKYVLPPRSNRGVSPK